MSRLLERSGPQPRAATGPGDVMARPVLLPMLGVLLAVANGAARADYAFSLAPSNIVAPDSRGFSNSTSTLLSAGTVSPAAPAAPVYDFLDSWHFVLGNGADIGGFVGSLNFVDQGNTVTQGIDNLELRLLGPGNINVVGWQSVANFGPVQQAFSVLAPSSYAAGSYALEVRGLLVGPTSAYAGTLQAVSPVPLPATLPLFAAGVLLLGAVVKRART